MYPIRLNVECIVQSVVLAKRLLYQVCKFGVCCSLINSVLCSWNYWLVKGELETMWKGGKAQRKTTTK
jgi:hypothetical protein